MEVMEVMEETVGVVVTLMEETVIMERMEEKAEVFSKATLGTLSTVSSTKTILSMYAKKASSAFGFIIPGL